VKDKAPTLAELGLNKKTSALAQQIAKLPDEQFEKTRKRRFACFEPGGVIFLL
jgi:hypothetical protein